MKKKRKAMLVGISTPIKIKSKKYVLERLYQRAKKNPFVNTDSFEDYLYHLKHQIKVVEGKEVDGGIDEIISTRRLINIVTSYMIFQNKEKAIEFSINRFDDDTKTGFMDLWTKVDPSATPDEVEDDSTHVQDGTTDPESHEEELDS